MAQDILEKYRLFIAAIQYTAEENTAISSADVILIGDLLKAVSDIVEHPTRLTVIEGTRE